MTEQHASRRNLQYKIINTLSIDISVGAVIVSYFFSLVFGVPPDTAGLLVLGLCVWIIYSMDHLLDAKRIKNPALTFRHQFHKRNFKVLWVTVVLMIAQTAAASILFLEKATLILGCVIAGIALLYLFFQKSLSFAKELVGALLYTAGVLVPVVSQSGMEFKTGSILIVFQFFLVVLLNLILFSFFDRRIDLSQKQESIATKFPITSITRFFWICFSFALMIGMLNFYFFPHVFPAIGVILIMTIVLGFIHYKNDFFSKHDRFRYIGDAIFFLPLLYIFFRL